jgi:hypothetical protein
MGNRFLAYLMDAPWEVLPQGYNEPIIRLYRALRYAVREQCDAIIFTPTEIILRRQDQRVHAFSIGGLQPDLGWRGYFDLIRTHDKYVDEHVHFVVEEPREAVYRIEKSDL